MTKFFFYYLWLQFQNITFQICLYKKLLAIKVPAGFQPCYPLSIVSQIHSGVAPDYYMVQCDSDNNWAQAGGSYKNRTLNVQCSRHLKM